MCCLWKRATAAVRLRVSGEMIVVEQGTHHLTFPNRVSGYVGAYPVAAISWV